MSTTPSFRPTTASAEAKHLIKELLQSDPSRSFTAAECTSYVREQATFFSGSISNGVMAGALRAVTTSEKERGAYAYLGWSSYQYVGAQTDTTGTDTTASTNISEATLAHKLALFLGATHHNLNRICTVNYLELSPEDQLLLQRMGALSRRLEEEIAAMSESKG